MGFWIFMLCMSMMMPVLMILFGWIFSKYPPKEINSIYGYRTKRSSKSKEAWEFAHRYFGGIWYKAGLALLPVTVVAMLPVLGKGEDAVGTWGGALVCLQMIPLLVPVWFTERALKREFD